MSDDAPKRSFPKKTGFSSSKKDVHKQKKKFLQTVKGSFGEAMLIKKVEHSPKHFKSSADGVALFKISKKKVADRMEVIKKGKAKFGAKKKKKAKLNESVRGTSIDHKMLGVSDDEMYSFEDDVMDVTDMLEDEGDETIVPVTNSKRVRSLNEKRNSLKKYSDDGDSEEGALSKGDKKKRLIKKSHQDKKAEENLGDEELEWPTSRRIAKDANLDNADDPENEDADSTVQNHANALNSKDNLVRSEVLPDRCDEELGKEEEDYEAAVAAFRAEMADLPLGKVREMKDKLGLKLFNKAYFGMTEKDKKISEAKKKAKEAMKEEYRGQHRPKEISSKKPVSTFRPVYNTTGKKKRDPRFDVRAGKFKERCFDDNYRFLEDLRKQEREELCKEATECEERGDAETAEKIHEVIRRMDNREKTKAERKMKEETLRELRQENIERMMRGERPVFKTKAQVKLMNMEKKFKQLKKDNKLDQYMKRKAKKEASKEARKKPAFEQMYGYY